MLEMMTENKIDELALLKERANKLGITYSNNIGVESLKKKINEFLEGSAKPEKKETPSQVRERLFKEATKLVRCKIINLNPNKRDLEGEIFTVANSVVGKVSKYVPYTPPASDSWHLPRILVDNLKDRVYVDVRSKQERRNRNQIEVSSEFVPEFNIIELPDLTQEELEKLAAAQAASKGLSE